MRLADKMHYYSVRVAFERRPSTDVSGGTSSRVNAGFMEMPLTPVGGRWITGDVVGSRGERLTSADGRQGALTRASGLAHRANARWRQSEVNVVWVGAWAALGLINVLAVAGAASTWPVGLVCVGGLDILLGYSTLAVLKIRLTVEYADAFMSVILGLGVIMLTGLAVNTLLPLFGDVHPLRQAPILVGFDVVFVGLVFAGRRNWIAAMPHIRRPRSLSRYGQVLLLVALPLAATSGAIALDNGREAGMTVGMLVACVAVLIWVYLARTDPISPMHLAALYAVALSLLFMTSMRGRYVTGHDIQHEFYVFQQAVHAQRWNVGNSHDAYAACLSITILPAALRQAFKLPDILVFKLYFQLFFALCPVGVFLVGKKLGGTRVGILAFTLFVAFPTYFSDMPFLNRQEVAFLFLTAFVLVIVDASYSTSRPRQHLLLVFLGVNIVLSHYSTTYFALGQLGVALVVLTSVRIVARLSSNRHWRLLPLYGSRMVGVRLLTWPLLLLLLVVAGLWNVGATHSSGSITAVAQNTFDQVTGRAKSAGAADTSDSLLNGSSASQAEVLRQYVKEATADRSSDGDYYPSSVIDKYPPLPARVQVAPDTDVGTALDELKVSSYSINSFLRANSARLLQVLVGTGVILMVFRKKGARLRTDGVFKSIAIGSLCCVAVLVAVPSLTLDYGLLRAFLQAFIVLSAVGAACLTTFCGLFGSRRSEGLAMLVAVVFLLSSTGLVATATGGYLPQLHLANAGYNYDDYYVHDSEVLTAEWFNTNVPPDSLVVSGDRVDPRTSANRSITVPIVAGQGILPVQLDRRAYVFLGYTNVVLGQAYAVFQNQGIQYTYPTGFLDSTKNLVFSTGQTEVFK
jgi:uncharacterized membrane protein